MTTHTADPAAARRHLETTADLVVVHDIMAEALSTLRGTCTRAAANHPVGSAARAWWLSRAVAVDDFREQVDVTDRTAMLDALDVARRELDDIRARPDVA